MRKRLKKLDSREFFGDVKQFIIGGHDFYKHIPDKKILKSYRDFLIKTKKTDTLIAIASK